MNPNLLQRLGSHDRVAAPQVVQAHVVQPGRRRGQAGRRPSQVVQTGRVGLRYRQCNPKK